MNDKGVYSNLKRANLYSTTKTNFVNCFVNLCKDRVTTKQKNHVTDRMECMNCQSACFKKSKHMKARSKEHMRSGKNCDLEKNEIDKHFR